MAELAPEQDPRVWDLVAEDYAKYLDPMTSSYVADLLRVAAPKEGERVLDVACGAGAVALPAARAGAEVLAVDLAPRFVEIVQTRARAEGISNLSARVMDGHALDLPGATFDVALSNFGVFLFPEREKGFAQMHRVLKAGGRAAVTSFHAPPANEWIAFFRECLQRALPDISPQPPKFLELADPKRLESELKDAGFAEVQVETVKRSTTWKTVEDAWGALAQSAPIFRPLLDKIGPEGVARLRAEFDRVAEERFGKDKPVILTAPANVALARKDP